MKYSFLCNRKENSDLSRLKFFLWFRNHSRIKRICQTATFCSNTLRVTLCYFKLTEAVTWLLHFPFRYSWLPRLKTLVTDSIPAVLVVITAVISPIISNFRLGIWMHGGYIYSNPSAVAISIVKSVWDACSLKGQLEKTRISKVLTWKVPIEVEKLSMQY